MSNRNALEITTVAVYATAIFASACLMFVVEPMVAKMLLPVFGGTPNVWNTCVVFFQVLLIAGYLYSHIVSTRATALIQVSLQILLVVSAAFLLPSRLPAIGDVYSNPTFSLLALLVVLVGAPFFVISTTAPLMSKWYSALGTVGSKDPYFLYAASNAGGILGLISYPFLIEPNLRLVEQMRLVGGVYIFYGVLVSLAAILFFLKMKGVETETADLNAEVSAEQTVSIEQPGSTDQSSTVQQVGEPGSHQYLHWLVLALVPQSLILGFTTYVTSELSAIPLFWIVPLLIYLLSFVIAFSGVPLVLRKVVRIAALALTIVSAALLTEGGRFFGIDVLTVGLSVQLLTLFFVCCACHMEIAAQRPSPKHLTNYFLTISIGGVLGSSINSFIAPSLFVDYIEYPLMLAVAGVLLVRSRSANIDHGLKILVAILGMLMLIDWSRTDDSVVMRKRNFFGCLSIDVNRESNTCEFYHGLTMHGSESLDPDERGVPISYYYTDGPIGKFFVNLFGPPETLRLLAHGKQTVKTSPGSFSANVHEQRRKYLEDLKNSGEGNSPVTVETRARSLNELSSLHQNKMPIAVLGLGTGTIAAFAKASQPVVYYEIDPAVVELAQNPIYFTYLFQAQKRGVDLKIVKGDGRLEIQKAPYKYFKVIVADAFSSDSIPTHLITKEALATYRNKLRDDGAVIFNISNHFYDLSPVLANLAADAGLAAYIYSDGEALVAKKQSSATWVVLTADENTKSILQVNGWKPLRVKKQSPLWTDDFCSPLTVLISPLS